MRFAAITALAVAALTSTAEAASANIINKCSFPVYAWSVDQQQNVSPRNNLAAGGGTYSETYRGLGISIKISKSKNVNSLYDGSPITQYQYSDNTNSQLVYYSLADTNGDLFSGNKVTLVPSKSTCKKIVWANGSGMSQIDSCADSASLTLTLCA